MQRDAWKPALRMSGVAFIALLLLTPALAEDPPAAARQGEVKAEAAAPAKSEPQMPSNRDAAVNTPSGPAAKAAAAPVQGAGKEAAAAPPPSAGATPPAADTAKTQTQTETPPANSDTALLEKPKSDVAPSEAKSGDEKSAGEKNGEKSEAVKPAPETKPEDKAAGEAKPPEAKAASESKPDSGKSSADAKPSDTKSAGDAKPDADKTGDKKESAEAAAPPPVPTDPIVVAAIRKLSETAFVGKADKADVAALSASYAERNKALWVDASALTSKAQAAMEEVRKADDWGLSASAFDLPSLPAGTPSTDALGEVEARLSLELLKYARYAKGGRVNPQSLSRILDQVPPIKDPKVVLADLSATDAPGIYLRDLHPKHEQFERLRQLLLKTRGGAAPEKEEPLDEALKVKLPEGATLKLGSEHPHVTLLRKRLKVPPADSVKEDQYDAVLAEAVKAFQRENGIAASGALTNGTRRALNSEGEPKKVTPTAEAQRILINMERWRWMPERLGPVYVWDNIPEFTARVIKGKEEIFKEKIIVGLPEWATPVFSADMKSIVFNPSWGVPDGIKMRELLPRLQSAGGGFFFFGGGGGDVLRAYGLTAYRNGRPVDPDSVNWGSVDIRQFSFVQPPGGKNPLGIVKFLFPNRHDVYMHDTIERELFAQSHRALSHGCMRVQNPRRFAEILLSEGQGWSDAKVASAISGGGDIPLEKPIPVHVTYFSAIVDAKGKMSTFGDIYGHDSRLSAALTGRALRVEPAVETASSDDYDPVAEEPQTKKGRKNEKKPASNYSAPASLADAISGLLTN